MKQEELYLHTLKLWSDAYLNNELKFGKACGCADGILFKHYMPNNTYMQSNWIRLFATGNRVNIDAFEHNTIVYRENDRYKQRSYDPSDSDRIRLELQKYVPYPLDFLMEVEWEFETNAHGKDADEKAFNGMMAAIKVLDRYHGVEGGGNVLKEVKNKKRVYESGNTCNI